MTRGLLLLALLTGCDDFRPSFVEPIGSTGEARRWELESRSNQAAGADRLGPIANDVTQVRYSMFDRWTPYLLFGDLDQGARPIGLQLPRVPDSELEQTVDVSSKLVRWGSLRVYDRGECSTLVPWEDLAVRFFNGFVDGLNERDEIDGASLVSGALEPVLRSEFTDPSSPPRDADRLRLSWTFFAEHIGPGPIRGCDEVEMSFDVEIEQVPSDLAWYRYTGDFVFIVAAACADPSVTIFTVEDELRAGRWAELKSRCGPMGAASPAINGYGTYSLDEIRDAQWVDNFLPVNGISSEVLLGFSSKDGVPLDAHDTLFRVRSFETTLTGTNCLDKAREVTRVELGNGVMNQIVDGVGRGLRDGLNLDPWLLGINAARFRCDSDTDCNMTWSDPAFALGPGDWQGGRHTCRDRDKEALLDLLRENLSEGDFEDTRPLIDGLAEGRFCHVQLEPDHLSFRPEALEVVVAYGRPSDAQGDMLRSSLPLGEALCAPDRDGLGPSLAEGSRLHVLNSPVTVP